jgi:hypothetical protein
MDLLDDGSFRGGQDANDACAPSGHWTADDDGRLLSTSFVRALVTCGPDTEVGDRLLAAARAGFDGERLVLLDKDRAKTALLVRRGSTPRVAARHPRMHRCCGKSAGDVPTAFWCDQGQQQVGLSGALGMGRNW